MRFTCKMHSIVYGQSSPARHPILNIETEPRRNMANLTVKDLPDPLYKKLKSRAHANRRSIAGEVTVLLERALGERPVQEEELRSRAERLRSRTPAHLTEETRRNAVRRGRT